MKITSPKWIHLHEITIKAFFWSNLIIILIPALITIFGIYSVDFRVLLNWDFIMILLGCVLAIGGFLIAMITGDDKLVLWGILGTLIACLFIFNLIFHMFY